MPSIKPRTWELTADRWYDYARSLDHEDGWPNGLSGNPIRVIELEPVLDVLERLHFAHEPYSNGDLRKDVTALLTTHGRLDG